MNLRSRLMALEAVTSNQLALVAWWLEADGQAASSAGVVDLVQESSETVSAFLDRAASLLPGKRVVWLDELDQRI